MIRNFFLVTLRSLRKNKIYAFINIAGLSIGITSSILILLWVFDELSYNRFLPKADRLYQLEANVTYDGKINTWGSAPLAAYHALKSENSHIVNTAVLGWGDNHLLTAGDHKVRKSGHYATEEFLTMFEFPLMQGNVSKVLSDPGSIVISEAVAVALFGKEDPINKTILVDNKFEQKITGIIKDIPGNSSFQFDCLLPWKLKEANDEWLKNNSASWENFSFGIYVELDNPKSLQEAGSVIRDLYARKAAIVQKDNIKHEFFLYPLTSWRLFSRFENGVITGGAIEYVRLFSIIAIFVLVIACINFMNLATARSERRAKEVGIRKSIGSGKRQLILQFIGESLLITTIAFSISILVAEIVLPFYNTLVQKHLHIQYSSPYFWLCSVLLIFFTGVVSGSYPAFYLSSFRPVQTLKGRIHTGKNASTPRKVLVTLQFGFSILLVIATLVIYRQVVHVKSRDMGFDRENLISVNYTEEIGKNFQVIKQELLTSGVGVAVTKSNSAITDLNSYGFLTWPGKPKEERVLFSNLSTEYDYTKTMGIKVLMGRDFSEAFKTDTAALLINKAALDMMGLKDPIGQQVSFPSGIKRTLVGVLENTVMTSPTEAVFPMFVEFQPGWAGAVTLRLAKTADLKNSIGKVEEIFKKFSPAYPFEYSFVDAEFRKKFTEISLIGTLANLFTVLALIITGLGLFGLASFSAEQRTKEIGIRKVLGASVTSLVTLMSKDFSKLVIVAFLLSAPAAWWMLTKFLSRYAYRTEIPWWVFPLTGLIALMFAIITVSTQALRAANANPVKSLRNGE